MPTLHPHQQKAVEETPDKWCLWWKMRVGKTPTSIRLACDRVKSAIIISPKSVVSHWEREVGVWADGNCEFKVISREQFKKFHVELPRYEAIIIDEIHGHFSNYKNQAYKALDSYIKKHDVKYIWGLSGTPMTANHWCVYSYGLLMGKKWLWNKWNSHFNFQMLMGFRRIWVPKKNMDKDLQKILHSIGATIDLKDIADVPEDEEIIESFKISPEQKKLALGFITELPIVRYTAEHQIEQGVKKGNGYEESIVMPCEKDKRIIEITNSADKIIIVCRYKDQIEKIKKSLLPLKRNIYVISGAGKESASDIAPRAENDPSAIVIAQCDTCVGYSLKSFNLMVFASMSFSFVNYDQMKSRMKSKEKTAPCQYIYLITEGDSIDKAVYDAVIKKQNFSIELYEKK